MSSPHLENLFTIPEATGDLWPLLVIQDDKDDDDDFSASIQIDNDHQWSSSSQAIMGNGSNYNGDKLDPILAFDHHQEISAVLLPDYTIEDNARTDELDSSEFILEPVDPGSNNQTDSSLMLQPESSVLAESSNGLKELNVSSKITRGRNHRFKQSLGTENKEVQSDNGEGTRMKKQEHNAKERIRRMKLHSSYLALGALLPADSSISKKKKKSAPLIIDRAVEYIPELENEIEKLTLRKNDMLSAINNKQCAVVNHFQQQDPSVSVHEIKQDELIVQICTQEHPHTAFSNLLQNVEEEEQQGISIMSASTLRVSDHGLCYHLHIKTNERLDGENHIASFKRKGNFLVKLIP